MKSNLYLIIKREYLQRVQRKSFIITTILTPLLMLVLMAAPSFVMLLSGPENKKIAVIDASGTVAPTLQSEGEMNFVSIAPDASIDSIKALTEYDAVLVIGNNVVDNPGDVQLYTHSAPSMQTESYIRNQIESSISDQRLKRYDIPNLDVIMSNVNVNVNMSTYRLDQEKEEATSSIMSYLIGMLMAMMLYMFIMIYGQMVMTSIIDEKNNRVLEIIVSSVKPKTLMMGKILGIGAVAVTQIVIWAALIGCFSRWIMPMLTAGATTQDADLLAALSMLGNASYIMSLFGYIVLFLITGYLLYSSIYAAIGSAVDNIQDASQLTTLAIVPIMLGFIFSMTVSSDPNSSLAVCLSMIPLTSPMVMMARIPFGIPSWEVWLSLAILVASVYFMIWFCAKVYRVGIFMYGKKPTIKDLIRWSRYK